MAKRIEKMLFVFLCTIVSQVAYAQDSCKDILANGILNTTQSSSAGSTASAQRALFCSYNYNEAKDYYERSKSNSNSGKLDIGFKFFQGGASGNGASSEAEKSDEFRKHQSQLCQSSSYDNQTSSFQFFAQSVVDKEIVKQWGECMSNKVGLTCWVSPRENVVFLMLNWKANSTTLPTVQQSFVDGGKSEFDGASENRLLPQQHIIGLGTLVIPIRRSDDKELTASITVSHVGGIASCEFYAPNKTDELKVVISRRDFGCVAKVGMTEDQQCFASLFIKPEFGNAICKVEVNNIRSRVIRNSVELLGSEVNRYVTSDLSLLTFDGVGPDGKGDKLPIGLMQFRVEVYGRRLGFANQPIADEVSRYVDVVAYQVPTTFSEDDRYRAGCDVVFDNGWEREFD